MISESDLTSLSAAVIERARQAGVLVGTAESCTGGMVCASLTEVAGSSEVVRGAVVSYATKVKERVLGVPVTITQDEGVGVVSEDCARAMAIGARTVLGCDVAVSVTGIAGPGGAEPGKPVGTVWIGVASNDGDHARHYCFEGNRHEVRVQTTACALELMLSAINLKK